MKQVRDSLPPLGLDWADWFPLHYRAMADRASMLREHRCAREAIRRQRQAAAQVQKIEAARTRLTERHAALLRERPSATITLWDWIRGEAGHGDRDACRVYKAECAPLWAEQRHLRAEATKAAVRDRLEHGFRWDGGAVGGNKDYQRVPGVFRGFVSEQHAILQLFVASTRRRHALRVGDTKAESLAPEAKILGLDLPYAESNKAVRRVLRAELDTVWPSWTALREAIAACEVPLPNVAVGYQDATGRVHRPHLIWLLDGGVPFKGRARQAPQFLFAAVLAALTAELLLIGADPGGLANLHRHKNPVSPLWDRQIMAEAPYALSALRDALPLAEAKQKLGFTRDTAAVGRTTPIPQEHPDPAVAAASNALFVAVSGMARDRITWHRDDGHGSEREFIAELVEEALRLVPYGPAAERVASRTAESVGTWTWANYRPRPQPMAPQARREARAAAGRRTAQRRSEATFDIFLAAARAELTRTGRRPTQAALATATGRSVDTVARHWKAVLNALAATPHTVPSDKKGDQLPVRSVAAPVPVSMPFSRFWGEHCFDCVLGAPPEHHGRHSGTLRPLHGKPPMLHGEPPESLSAMQALT